MKNAQIHFNSIVFYEIFLISYTRGVKLIFTVGHISIMAALKGLVEL